MISILHLLRTVDPSLHADADMCGPFLFLLSFGLFQLLAGKFHFGIILGWVTVASLFLYFVSRCSQADAAAISTSTDASVSSDTPCSPWSSSPRSPSSCLGMVGS
ncbi:hypothetical protein E2562_000247 [Oryza meyeriana var. granulata]|uniref:Uncharacterized protein n=1 Tax=Oryza meyeriana var. granulata TaxID=110450 RepID=A0A6G1CNI5_9ORYZ|nr:hypothetical protein E2562_000247 [Oryza meyeriana var. granulata]